MPVHRASLLDHPQDNSAVPACHSAERALFLRLEVEDIREIEPEDIGRLERVRVKDGASISQLDGAPIVSEKSNAPRAAGTQLERLFFLRFTEPSRTSFVDPGKSPTIRRNGNCDRRIIEFAGNENGGPPDTGAQRIAPARPLRRCVLLASKARYAG